MTPREIDALTKSLELIVRKLISEEAAACRIIKPRLHPDAPGYTVPEAAKVMRVTASTIYRLIKHGELRTVSILSKRYIPPVAIRMYYEIHTRKAAYE